MSGFLSGFTGLLANPFLATGTDAPAQPPALLGFLQLLRRELDYAIFDRLPVAQPIQTSQTAAGTVTGSVGGYDADGQELSYDVTQGPAKGAVVVDAAGVYTYTASAAFAATGGTDTFTVSIDDGVRSLIQLDSVGPSLFQLSVFADTGKISVPVTVTVAPPNAVATIGVGGRSSGVALSADGNRAYVTNATGNSVSVIDTATGTVTATIADVGNFPIGLVLSPDGSTAYVANAYGDSVTVIDTATNAVTASIDLGTGATPSSVALSPNGTRAYVTNNNANTVSVIDTGTNLVITTIVVGANPQAVVVSADGTRAYVANISGRSVSVIDTTTNAVAVTAAINGDPDAIALSPDGTRAYVAGYDNGTVSVIDTTTGALLASLDVGTNPDSIVVSLDGTRAYTANAGDGTVSVIDAVADTVIGTVAVGSDPNGVAVNPDGTQVYAANFADGTLSAITIAPGTPGSIGGEVNAAALTRGFDVYNLSRYPITFTGYPQFGSAAESGPKVGTVIQPGLAAHFEVPFYFFYDNQVTANFSSSQYGLLRASFIVKAAVAGQYVFCSGGPACGPSGVANSDRVLFYDAPGTIVAYGPQDGQAQAQVLNNLCVDGALATCEFDATREELTSSSPHQAGSTIKNNGTGPITRSISVSDVVTNSDSLGITTKVGVKFSKIVNFEISTTYQHTWTASHTFTETITVPIEPGFQSRIIAEQPVFRDYGDFKLVAGNTTFILRDVYFDTPRPEGESVYDVITERIPAALAATRLDARQEEDA